MITLYRRTGPDSVEYWEAWQSEPRALTLHKGQVGDIGLTAAVKVSRFRSAEKTLAAEIAEARAEGYAEVLPADHVQMVVQLPMGEDPEADLAHLSQVEALVEEVLGWTGNGTCDGHDLGAGSMNVFTETVVPQAAVTSVVEALQQADIEDFVVAVRHSEEPEVVWPAEAQGPFRY